MRTKSFRVVMDQYQKDMMYDCVGCMELSLTDDHSCYINVNGVAQTWAGLQSTRICS